jgi:hypothetical protein
VSDETPTGDGLKVPVKVSTNPSPTPGQPASRAVTWKGAGMEIHHWDADTVFDDPFLVERIIAD